MDDNLSDKLNAIISNPEMMKTISALANSFGGENRSSEYDFNKDVSSLSGSDNIRNAIVSISNTSDSRIDLLNALKPYMRRSRAVQVDNAIRILKLTKLTSVLKDI